MDVVFRVFPTGEVIALLCGTGPDCNSDRVMSYMHVGQHGEASRNLGQNLRLASPEEHAPLLSELRGIYSFVTPVKRLYVNPRNVRIGTIKPLDELQGERYQLVTDSQDIEAALEHVTKRGMCRAKREDITGAIVSVGNAEYDEIWLTVYRAPHALVSQYWCAHAI